MARSLGNDLKSLARSAGGAPPLPAPPRGAPANPRPSGRTSHGRARFSACMTAIRAGSEPGASTATACTAPHHRTITTKTRHASVEQLSVPVITAIAGSCLVSRDTLADINPTFENDTNIVPIPPEQSAFSNCEKVVERDVEVYRKKA